MNLFSLFLDDFGKGGIIMWVIFFVTIVAWMTGAGKLVSFVRFSSSRRKFLEFVNSLFKNNTGQVETTGCENYDILLDQLKKSIRENGNGARGIMREFLIGTVPFLENHLSTMSVWISVAPLLGLLGTVIGMIETFRIIMNFGVGNPSLTAEGISIALLTTQAGLVSAFPAMIFHNYLRNRKNALVAEILKDCEIIAGNMISLQYRTKRDV